ncbi:SDR family NAD(P)-dependent oxidoreductase [Marinactinospora thermotolerans]|uniref:SDR family NAD(P)-dependent oxidoreductase n=1 Tax=Marinactinospora thermotolerans TaxID=531310 RepID=UPI0022864F27|nr:SDR family NAD(P)-dependent oxidoreductase [Marinactinospora thermotolerans]
MIDTGLSGSVVLVTGAAGGIGAAIARAFAAQGAKVAVHHLATPPRPRAGFAGSTSSPRRRTPTRWPPNWAGSRSRPTCPRPTRPAGCSRRSGSGWDRCGCW